jgi:hypothetical protein
MKYLLIFFILAGFVSCSKDEKPLQQNTQKNQQEVGDMPADTNLTPEEKFSASIMIDFLEDIDDEDLAGFLETEIYRLGGSFNGAAVVEITPSTWLVSFEKDGAVKNYLLQRFVDFRINEYYFSLKETNLTITDIFTKAKNKTSAGDQ